MAEKSPVPGTSRGTRHIMHDFSQESGHSLLDVKKIKKLINKKTANHSKISKTGQTPRRAKSVVDKSKTPIVAKLKSGLIIKIASTTHDLSHNKSATSIEKVNNNAASTSKNKKQKKEEKVPVSQNTSARVAKLRTPRLVKKVTIIEESKKQKTKATPKSQTSKMEVKRRVTRATKPKDINNNEEIKLPKSKLTPSKSHQPKTGLDVMSQIGNASILNFIEKEIEQQAASNSNNIAASGNSSNVQNRYYIRSKTVEASNAENEPSTSSKYSPKISQNVNKVKREVLNKSKRADSKETKNLDKVKTGRVNKTKTVDSNKIKKSDLEKMVINDAKERKADDLQVPVNDKPKRRVLNKSTNDVSQTNAENVKKTKTATVKNLKPESSTIRKTVKSPRTKVTPSTTSTAGPSTESKVMSTTPRVSKAKATTSSKTKEVNDLKGTKSKAASNKSKSNNLSKSKTKLENSFKTNDSIEGTPELSIDQSDTLLSCAMQDSKESKDNKTDSVADISHVINDTPVVSYVNNTLNSFVDDQIPGPSREREETTKKLKNIYVDDEVPGPSRLTEDVPGKSKCRSKNNSPQHKTSSLSKTSNKEGNKSINKNGHSKSEMNHITKSMQDRLVARELKRTAHMEARKKQKMAIAIQKMSLIFEKVHYGTDSGKDDNDMYNALKVAGGSSDSDSTSSSIYSCSGCSCSECENINTEYSVVTTTSDSSDD